MVTKGLNLKFLKDSPARKGDKEYYEFYHEYISPTLNKITKEQKNVHTIGLFGNWGSGKSTIIENLKIDYADSPLFLFDVWKYKGDPLRRTFLLKFYDFVDSKKLWARGKKVKKSELDALYESESTQKSEKKETSDSKIKGFFKFIWSNLLLLAILTFIISLFVLHWQQGAENPLEKYLGLIIGYVGQAGSIAILFAWMLKKFVDKLIDRLFESFNTDIKTHTVIKTREYLNSPEQFEEKFLKIVSALSKKTIVVFDNIDRVQGDIAIEILSAIKTFIEPGEESEVIFIIPCDADAIEAQVKKYYGDSFDSNEIDTTEYLRKLFNIVIWTPDFIPTDLEDFTKKQIDEIGEDEGLLKDNDDIIRIVTQSFKSPREIKQFLNNLIAAIMIAYETDVWEEVKNNIAYLAKVLILKQKFPKAYKLLKERWYNPDDIIPDTNENNKALRDFLTVTNTIQVANAEPYIYFKISNTEKLFPDSKVLLPALISEDIEKSKEIINKNLDNLDVLLDFVLGLYGKYRAQENWLSKIIKTFIVSVDDVKLSIEKTSYFNRTAEVIDRYIWQSYRDLDIEIVFSMFVRNTKVSKNFRDNLLKRYTAALSSKEITSEKSQTTATDIVQNLSLVKNILPELVEQISKTIESSYVENPEILDVLDGKERQKRFISKTALEKYIQTITLDNFRTHLPVVMKYKSLIREYSSENILINALIPMVSAERTSQPEDNPAKQELYEIMHKLFIDPDSLIDNSDTTLLANLETEVNNVYNGISSTDNKIYVVPVLYRLAKFTGDTHQDVATGSDDRVSDYITNSSKESLEDLLERLGRDSSNFVYEFSSSFTDRAISKGGDEIEKAYEIMNDTDRQEVLNGLISGRPDFGVPYIRTRSNLPNRIETINKLLSAIADQPPNADKAGAYDLLANLTKKGDIVEIKESAMAQIESLIMTDDVTSEEVGYDFLNKAAFLSNTQKQAVIQKTFEWIKTPGKIISHANRHALKLIAENYSLLNSSEKEEFVAILFDVLSRPGDRASNTVAIEILQLVRPKFSEYQQYYDGFKNSIDSWGNVADRDFVISELEKKVKSKRQSKREREYWEVLSSMATSEQ